MIIVLAILFSSVHLAAWLGIAALELDELESVLLYVWGAFFIAFFVFALIVLYPPSMLLFLFTAVYSWRVLYITHEKSI